MTPPLDIAALRRLVAEATPGEWRVELADDDGLKVADAISIDGPSGWGAVLCAGNLGGICLSEADARLIVAAVNSVGALCDRVEEAEREVDHLREMVRGASRRVSEVEAEIVANGKRCLDYTSIITAERDAARAEVEWLRAEVEHERANVVRLAGKVEQWRELAMDAATSLGAWSESEDCCESEAAEAVWDALAQEKREEETADV